MKKTSLAMNKLFPVFGFTLGKVTPEEFRNRGYYVEKEPYGDLVCRVRGLIFWDHNQNGRFEDIYATTAEELPEDWENKFGLCWRLSYNGWIEALKNLGFEIEIDEEPHVVINEKKSEELIAEVSAVTPERDLSLKLEFKFGNDFGEGATPDSPRSLYSLTMTTDLD